CISRSDETTPQTASSGLRSAVALLRFRPRASSTDSTVLYLGWTRTRCGRHPDSTPDYDFVPDRTSAVSSSLAPTRTDRHPQPLATNPGPADGHRERTAARTIRAGLRAAARFCRHGSTRSPDWIANRYSRQDRPAHPFGTLKNPRRR